MQCMYDCMYCTRGRWRGSRTYAYLINKGVASCSSCGGKAESKMPRTRAQKNKLDSQVSTNKANELTETKPKEAIRIIHQDLEDQGIIILTNYCYYNYKYNYIYIYIYINNGTLDIARGRARVSCHESYNLYHLPCLLEVPFFTLDPKYL